jgi:hypothetical protein
MAMALSFDLYWSFRSPYSYIALPRVAALARDFVVDVEVRVVHPAAIRNPAYFRAMNPMSRPYFLLDSAREAAFRGLPFRRPVPDPIVQDQRTLAIAGHQPHIHRLSRLGIAAAERGRGLAFCDEVSRVLWDGSVDNWHEGGGTWRTPRDVPGSTSRNSTAPSPPSPGATRRRWPPTTRRCARLGTGACPRPCSAACPSSARTAWTPWSGASASTGSGRAASTALAN